MRLWRRTDDERKGITPEKFKGSADFQIIYYCFTHPNEDIVVLTSDGNLKRIIRWLGLEKVRFVSIYDGVLAAAWYFSVSSKMTWSNLWPSIPLSFNSLEPIDCIGVEESLTLSGVADSLLTSIK